MDSCGWDLKSLFGRALDHDDEAARRLFLDQACGDDSDIRQQVEKLLLAHEVAAQFLGSTPGPAPATTAPGSNLIERPGSLVGPYKLLQQIGEGGMGVVFMAEQDRPIRRKVALKVIKPGMDTRQVIARFEAERQALALMEHPNIARVLDGGATTTGRPYFVMELVRGVPITEYCDRNQLTPRERLELFVPVCRAIQHAHQKGIIHRDIKPSNVLVTLHDGVPEPKVIDFGVAKAVEQRLTERTMFTEFGAILGTLEYMSPEQAEMGALDIDTRSDIYSLGVLLYELLTGSTPLDKTKMRDADFSEILRRVREEDFPRPSNRLSQSHHALPAISAQRKTEPARLSRLVRGELDWIVMKSLEKDRTRRYDSALSFARDVQRYLAGEAVAASPPSTLYRVTKFARKNRGFLITAGLFLTLLIGTTAISLILAVRAIRSDRLARDQSVLAQENELVAIEALSRFSAAVRDNPELSRNAALAQLRETLLREPHASFRTIIRRIQENHATSPTALARLAAASFELGALSSEIGDKDEALQAYEHARKLWGQLVELNRHDTSALAGVARSDYEVGLLIEARGQTDRALSHFEEARAIRLQLLGPNPAEAPEQDQADLALTYHCIGNLEKRLNHSEPARVAFEAALPIWRRLTAAKPGSTRYLGDLTWSLSNLGLIQHDPARLAEALQAYQSVRTLRDKLADENPTAVWAQLDRTMNLYYMGVLQAEMGRKGDALVTMRETIPLWRKLIESDRANRRYPLELARTWLNIGEWQTDLGALVEARAGFAQARELWSELRRDHTHDPDFAVGLARTERGMAQIDERQGDLASARNQLNQAIELLDQTRAAHPDHLDSPALLRACLLDLARILTQLDRPVELRKIQGRLESLQPSGAPR